MWLKTHEPNGITSLKTLSVNANHDKDTKAMLGTAQVVAKKPDTLQNRKANES